MNAGVVLADAVADAATVSGVATNQIGGPVAGATVTLTRDGRTVGQTLTDAEGSFELVAPEAGRYDVRVTAPGFLPRALDAFFVPSSGRIHVAVSLSIGITQAVVVTAAASELPVSQVAAPVTVIGRETLDNLATPNVADALRLVPGVAVLSAGARGAATALFVRGGASNFNKVVIDGVPANDIGGAFDFEDLSTTAIDRIEVLRDANSVRYGSDALAGVVDISTEQGRTRIPRATYSGRGGSFGTRRHEVTLGGAAARVSYFAAASSFDTDNEGPNNAYRNRSVVGRVDLAPGGNTNISAVVRRGTGSGGVPGASAYFGVSDDSTRSSEATLLSVTADTQVSPRVTTMARFAMSKALYHSNNPTPTGEAFDPFG
ncbi:MAG: TonB-dependent receptor plug domain-containing protein, partial [Acidobacteriota bacterium]